MSDEDSEDEGDIQCPICRSIDSCKHQLFFYDVTFGETMAGVVDKDELERMIATAFVTAIKEGSTPDWHDPEISELFERIDEAYTAEVLTAEEPWLPDWLPIRVLIDLLEDAGGIDIGCSLLMPSGGRCDSAVRAVYAKKPAVVYEKAKAMLAARLEKDLHPKPDLPPLNGSISGARILGGRTPRRAIDATWKARAGGSDNSQAA